MGELELVGSVIWTLKPLRIFSSISSILALLLKLIQHRDPSNDSSS